MASGGDCVLRSATPIASLRPFGLLRQRLNRDIRRRQSPSPLRLFLESERNADRALRDFTEDCRSTSHLSPLTSHLSRSLPPCVPEPGSRPPNVMMEYLRATVLDFTNGKANVRAEKAHYHPRCRSSVWRVLPDSL